MQPWQIWIILGIIFTIIEIFDPAFFFVALGIAALITGLLSLFYILGSNVLLQIIIFSALSFICFLLTRKIGKKILQFPTAETNIYALKGKTGFVTKAIPQDGKGYVKVGGEEWSAISEDGSPIEENTKVIVLGVEGNKLIVKKAQ